MTTQRSNAGDPARTVALLWRHQIGPPAGSRGPRQGLDVDDVVTAAVALADEAGLDALTMRAVAGRLGTSPMTLYTYVPGKAELLDCVVDQLYASHPRQEPATPGWRAAAEAVAHDEWALYLGHPWLVQVARTRPVLGPGSTAAYEHGLHVFDGTGIDDVGRDAALTLLMGFVRECARLNVDAHDAEAASGTDDEGWWEQVSPRLLDAMGPERFPLAARVGTTAGRAHNGAYSAEHAFTWGLTRVLDGLERHLEDDLHHG